MQRRLVVSLVLGVLLVVLQLLLLRTGWPIALLTGLIAFVVAFLVLMVSDRYSRR
jgi:uncharacterized membrane protein YvlD (DUF360 family)